MSKSSGSQYTDGNDDGFHLVLDLQDATSQLQLQGVTEEEYVSYTLDWWDAASDGDDAWPEGTTLATLRNWSADDRLVAFTKGLAPAFLRVGGSKADKIRYLGFDQDINNDINTHVMNNSTSSQNRETNDNTVLDSYCQKFSHRCLTPQKWNHLLNFRYIHVYAYGKYLIV